MARKLRLISPAVNSANQNNQNYKPLTIFTSNQGGLTLKSSLKITALVVCAFSLAGTLNAQNSNGGMVAVLDVAKVFEGNTVFTNRMEAIKAEATKFKSQMEEEQLARHEHSGCLFLAECDFDTLGPYTPKVDVRHFIASV